MIRKSRYKKQMFLDGKMRKSWLRFIAVFLIINVNTERNVVENMGLDSTVVTLNNLFRFNFSAEFQTFLGGTKQQFSIPDYQREYKWEEAKIKTFVKNVMQRSKFLGIITIEVRDCPYLSVVDGQQRLITIMLMLAWLYNACADEDEVETQREILDLCTCTVEGQQRFKLDNASVGEYMHLTTDEEGRSRLELKIDPQKDIFRQASQFSKAWKAIGETASKIYKEDKNATLDGYKQKLLDCEILLFAQKDLEGRQQGSIEEIYIDINEKSQTLDPEDICKGHCFAICKAGAQQENVKMLWRSIRENFFSMDPIFKKISMDTFLHFYLLTQEAIRESREDIKNDLTVDGNNIISQRYNSPTLVIKLIKDIDQYQKNLLSFQSNLSSARPEFRSIMTATAQELGNNRERLTEMQDMLNDIFECRQNLFKLPLFYMIDSNMRKPEAKKSSYTQTAGFLYLYDLYMFLFARIGTSRKRGDLANDLIKQISSGQNFLLQFIKEIKSYAGSLNPALEEKVFRDEKARKQLYQLLDYFCVNSARQPAKEDADLSIQMRHFPVTYNKEHLIVNQSHKIVWTSASYKAAAVQNNTRYEFSTEDFRTCQPWIKPNNHWANFVWVDGTFNRERLENRDIISKIFALRGHCRKDDQPANETYAKKHAHIELICQHIMRLDEFEKLFEAHQNDAPRETVRERYQAFLEHYFSEDSETELRKEFSDRFKILLSTLYSLL